MDNVNIESLREKFGIQAETKFREIADQGGWGSVDPEYRGGLDIKGMREAGKDEKNPNRADCAKRAAELDRILGSKV